ncbi:hypothetical protein [Neptuniibacter sp. QD37_11]|uniref:hypothetical protein n=1 Tax=Neptuniibacter sp. QD37_11 TaxID=3398209 RepID=UPI0039F56987
MIIIRPKENASDSEFELLINTKLITEFTYEPGLRDVQGLLRAAATAADHAKEHRRASMFELLSNKEDLFQKLQQIKSFKENS